MKNIACSKFWTDLIIRGHLQQITHCCRRPYYDISLETLENYKEKIFNDHPLIIDERSRMIKTNSLTEGCVSCTKAWPNSDWHSWNEWQNKDWSEQDLNNLSLSNKINKIEISFSNKCNFSCMYCGPEYSSTWSKILGENLKNSNNEWLELALESLYNFIDVNKDYKFGFIGGEPLLDLEVLNNIKKLVNKINTNKNNQIYIITSLGVKEKTLYNFLELVHEYSKIKWRISISLDSIHSNGLVIRDGLNLKTFENNLNILLNDPNIDQIGFLPTISTLNIISLKDTINWFLDKKNQSKSNVTIKSNAVEYPFAMNPSILPVSYKQIIQECIDLLSDNEEEFKRHLTVIKNKIGTKRTPESLREAKEWYILQGKIKNKNYFELLPELNDILDIDKH